MLESAGYIIDYSVDRRIEKRLNRFGLGFIVYISAYTVAAAFAQNYNIIQVLQLLGLLLLIPSALGLIYFKFENKYLKTLYILYCLWLVFVIVRGFIFTSIFLEFMFFNPDFGLLAYFVPLILLFPRDLEFYKKIFAIISVFGIIYILYDLVFIKIILSSDRTPNSISQNVAERFSKCLSIPIGFLLLTFDYHSKKRKLIAVGVGLLTLLITVIRARRGLMFICSTSLIFAVILYFSYARGKIFIVLFSILILFVAANFISAYFQNKNNIFSYLMERSDEDTRTTVEICYYADMQTQDWVVGKGINGQYFCPDIDENDTTGYRDNIETDYLNIILKGGLVSLGLLLLIAIPAIIKGLFYSKNRLSKAAGIWILLWLFSIYPSNVTTFSLNYMLVWISIGICYSKTIRNMPDDILKEYFRTSMK